MGGSSSPPPSPEEQARSAYNTGVKVVEKADGLSADAAHQADPKKQSKALDKAQDGYASALKKFTRATELNPSMHEAWNYVGYTNRKLGKYDAALAAYDRALTLKPATRGHRVSRARLPRPQSPRRCEERLPRAVQQQSQAGGATAGRHADLGGRASRQCRGVDGASLDVVRVLGERAQRDRQPDAGLTREGAGAAW
jgi:tetratricopeptide (TPR) repeat protein